MNPIQASEEKLIAEFASRPPLTRKHHIEWLRTALREHRAVLLEEAARVCERIAWSNKNTYALGPELNAANCATAIRALAGKENV